MVTQTSSHGNAGGDYSTSETLLRTENGTHIFRAENGLIYQFWSMADVGTDLWHEWNTHPLPIEEPKRHKRRSLSKNLKAVVWEFTHGQCWYCGSHFNPYRDMCIDHVVPLARGGSNAIENLVPCCTHCNAMKGTKLLDEWRENFDRVKFDSSLDEEPWCDPSGVFWFERDDFFQRMRADEIRMYRKFGGI